MKNRVTKGILVFLLILNLGCIVAALMGAAAPYINPVKFWPVAIAGLGFPFAAAAMLIFAFIWLLLKPRWSIFSLIGILLCTPAFIASFGTNIFSSFKKAKAPHSIRLLSWNVGLMNYTEVDTVLAKKNNATIFEKIKAADADILCLQEFFTEIIPGNHYNVMDSLANTLGYPYYYFSRDVPKVDGNFFSGSIIFSRHKIIDSSKSVFPLPGLYSGSIIRTGILIGTDTINVFTSRLQLMRFQGDEYRQLQNIKTVSGNSISDTKSIIGKLRYGYYFLSQQAEFVRTVLDSSYRPYLFAGDLNNIPLSYTYGKVKGKLNDAWAKKGKGFGRTFQYISPTLRLDHLFYDEHFKLGQVTRILEDGETDHHGLLGDFTIKAKR
ncbi:MAG: hypothetical protein EOO06_01395 [Chitinophagaceae bacterium]|nr:MAG: hypothetical protein EOO06_01395 [Chitinophagaceae bacterium]